MSNSENAANEKIIYIDENEINKHSYVLNANKLQDNIAATAKYSDTINGEKCLIILALSSFPKTRNEDKNLNYYQMKENSYPVGTDRKIIGSYQLEPVPKYIIDEYLKQNHKKYSIEFIILETNAVYGLKQDKVTVLRGDKTNKHEDIIVTKTSEGEERNPTEREYFSDSMLNYVRDKDIEIEFDEYRLSSNEIENDISELMVLIRHEAGIHKLHQEGNGGDGDSKIVQDADIYVDIHGGPRSTQQLMINLMSILREEGITIEPSHILTVEGGEKPIKPAGESFLVNDFVSGIHEFVNYGKMESLNKFYNKRPKMGENEKNLIDTMKKVSYAIQLCDMYQFNNLLVELATNIDKFTKSNEKGYLYAFRDLIIRGYDPIIVQTEDGFEVHNDAISEIKWCENKGLFQQMLTLCESMMPEYLVNKGVIEYDEFLLCIGEKQKGNFNLYNYLFNNTFSNFNPDRVANIDKSDGNFEAFLGKVKMFYSLNTDKEDTLRKLLEEHYQLKNIRNHNNHGSNNASAELDSIARKIENYLTLVENAITNRRNDAEHSCIFISPVKDKRISASVSEIESIENDITNISDYIGNIADNNTLPADPQLNNIRIKKTFALIKKAITNYNASNRDNVDQREQYLKSTREGRDQDAINIIRHICMNKGAQNPPAFKNCIKDNITNGKSGHTRTEFWKFIKNGIESHKYSAEFISYIMNRQYQPYNPQ